MPPTRAYAILTRDGSPLAWSREGLRRGGLVLPVRRRDDGLSYIASDIWINQSDSYSNFALLLIAGWAFAIGVGAGIELARRRDLPLKARPGGLVVAAILYGAIPAAAVAIAIGAAQSLVRAVL